MFNSNKKFELSPRLKLGVRRGYTQNQALKISGIICLLLAGLLSANALRLVLTASGKTVSSDAQVLGVSDSLATEEPQTPEVQFVEYKVEKGDTLFNISQKFNISWSTLATLNNLKSPFTVKPGDTIRIPK